MVEGRVPDCEARAQASGWASLHPWRNFGPCGSHVLIKPWQASNQLGTVPKDRLYPKPPPQYPDAELAKPCWLWPPFTVISPQKQKQDLKLPESSRMVGRRGDREGSACWSLGGDKGSSFLPLGTQTSAFCGQQQALGSGNPPLSGLEAARNSRILY